MIYMKRKEIATQRLFIREHEMRDIEAMHKLYSDENVMYYLENLKSLKIEDTISKLNEAINEQSNLNRKKFYFKIEDEKNYIGEIGFTIIDDLNKKNIADIGFFILSEFWGNGFAAEAA